MICSTLIHNTPKDSDVEIVTVLVINPKKEFLICRRSPFEHRAGEWECPGGHRNKIKRREPESIEQAGIREVLEETGLYVNINPAHKAFFTTREDSYGVMLVGNTINTDIKLDRKEHDKYKWLKYSDIKDVQGISVPSDFWRTVSVLLKSRKASSISKMYFTSDYIRIFYD